jgi:methyl-accepting chemotaxis protein
MFSIGTDKAQATLAAIGRSQALIEFAADGRILHANENFCKTMGYSLEEIKGKHHRLFVADAEASSPDYRSFWERLARGEFQSGQFQRIAKGGREVWLEASYNPVVVRGKVVKITKIATDITIRKRQAAEDAGKLEAISRSQAVIEFMPSGEILTANANFLSAVGYGLSEIVGKHHSIFCDPTYSASEDYRSFWRDLAAGLYKSGEVCRYRRDGSPVWIIATYNPILDANGKVFKVVKFATDVTERVNAVDSLADGLHRLAEGDLSQPIETAFPPNLEKLRHDYNHSVEKLMQAMEEVRRNSRAIESGAAEIRGAADDLARRTEQQAASVEETAAALEEITTAVADASRRAAEAGALVNRTRDSAQASSQIVRDAIVAMGAIESSSSEISNIIGVIDEIAFQTNLLALNAGVEAARAGEAGKGFAVVAQEVRELAQRSANAAKQIKALINTSSQQVKDGVGLVARTGEALESIARQVAEITGNVGAIVESSREQATGLKEINDTINIMDQTTQKNAAMVEQTTATTHGLVQEVETLNRLLSSFRLAERSSASGVRQPARRRNAA